MVVLSRNTFAGGFVAKCGVVSACGFLLTDAVSSRHRWEINGCCGGCH